MILHLISHIAQHNAVVKVAITHLPRYNGERGDLHERTRAFHRNSPQWTSRFSGYVVD